MLRPIQRVLPPILLAGLVYLIATSIAVGDSAGGYEIGWWVIAGGARGQSGGLEVTDAIGQPLASSSIATDGKRYALSDGYWWATPTGKSVYLPMVFGGATLP